jgi:hypothetical protein
MIIIIIMIGGVRDLFQFIGSTHEGKLSEREIRAMVCLAVSKCLYGRHRRESHNGE